MDAKHINNILAAFTNIMPMLGMDDVQKKGMLLKGKDIHSLVVKRSFCTVKTGCCKA